MPVVNAMTVTREEFRRTVPLAQSFAGQAARHGVTPDGSPGACRPEREPTPKEIRELAIFRLRMADRHREMANFMMRDQEPCHPECLGREIQWGLERSFKGLLAAGNDGTRFRRDAALMWGRSESIRAIRDRNGAKAMADLLAATTGPDGLGCRLTGFSEAWRRDLPMPELSVPEWKAVRRCWAPAVDALIKEALARSGATLEDLRQEKEWPTGAGLAATSETMSQSS